MQEVKAEVKRGRDWKKLLGLVTVSAAGEHPPIERQPENGDRKADTVSLPATLSNGFLPPGVHTASLHAIVERFGTATPRRQVLAERLGELLRLARATGQLQRMFLWGSFPTDVPFPRDLDVFLLMQEGFDREFMHLPPMQRDVFAHARARLRFEADVFWATEAIGTEELAAWSSVYQLSRDMVPRGIVEVIWDD
jgi:hypothetical protein